MLIKKIKAEKAEQARMKPRPETANNFSNLDDNLKMVESGMTPIKRTVQYGTEGKPISELGSQRTSVAPIQPTLPKATTHMTSSSNIKARNASSKSRERSLGTRTIKSAVIATTGVG